MSESTHVGELLQPLGDALEQARFVLVLAAGVVLLIVAGAKLERFLMKQQLQVLDGEEETGGDRG